MNKPVISTDVGIASELEGVTIVERDVDSIKKALRKLSGRIQILEEYIWSNIAKQYMNIYVRIDGTQGKGK
jgi:glycosyltransferase involved in cell wall biosynthesis